jgi:DNA-binding IclR family transcriptional regulator
MNNSNMKEHVIPSVGKAIDVILTIAENSEPSRVKELAQLLGISQTTCYRILKTFVARNWVRPLVDGGFELSDGLMPVVRRLSGRMKLETVLQPVLDQFVRQVGISGKVSVRKGDEVYTVLRSTAERPMALSGQTGLYFSLGYGSGGAILLADLPDKEIEAIFERAEASVWARQSKKDAWKRVTQCREKGFCEDFGGYLPHIFTISVPVRDPTGRLLAAITVMGLPDELRKEELPRLRMALMRTKAEAENAVEQLG